TRTLAGGFALGFAIIFWFASTPHRTEFFFEGDPGFTQVFVKARGHLSPEAQDMLVRQGESRLTGIKGVEALYVRAGGFSSNGGPNSAPNDTVGRIRVDFLDYEERIALGLSGKQIEDEVRKRVTDIPGMQIEVRGPQNGPPVGKDIQVQLSSHDPA